VYLAFATGHKSGTAQTMLAAVMCVAAACGNLPMVHRVQLPPESALLGNFYRAAKLELPVLELPATWSNAKAPTRDALSVFRQYVDINTKLPPLSYVSNMEGDTVGLYKYTATESKSIEIQSDLDESLEFYVALHELLHFAGFGNLHGTVDANSVAANWHREFDSGTDPVIKTHWESVSGKHRRLGTPASSEIMTADMTGNIFLSATTLLACNRPSISQIDVCIDDADCAAVVCDVKSSSLPGQCSPSRTVPNYPQHTQTWETSDTAMVVALTVPIIFVAGLLLI